MILDHKEQDKILKKYGLKVPKTYFIESKKQVSFSLSKIGFPVVMKIFSKKHLHRTEVGGVVKNIKNRKEAEIAFTSLFKIKDTQGVLIQKQVSGVEFIVGVKKDSLFGDVIMLGTGGTMVEVFDDVTFRVLPIRKNDALKMIEEIKGKKLLEGFRGLEKIDKNKLADILVKVSNLADKEEYREIDLNPVILNHKGAYVCDVKIVV